MKPAFLVVGGDRRQTFICARLRRHFSVYTLCVPQLPDRLPQEPVHIILPCPAFSPDGTVRAGPEREALVPYLQAQTCVFCAMPGVHRSWLEQRCACVIDLLDDPLTAAQNAALTAQAAICLTLKHTERSLLAQRCVVAGWGRIAAPLARYLCSFGAHVCVLARSPLARECARVSGFDAQDFSAPLPQNTTLFFNTVPAQVLSRAALNALSADCLWIELASAPGGLPDGEFAFSMLPAPSLPGRLLPDSAAEVLCRAILRNLEVSIC